MTDVQALDEDDYEATVAEAAGEEDEGDEGAAGGGLSEAARARAERQRLRARALRAARLPLRARVIEEVCKGSVRGTDTGGGFLLEEVDEEEEARRAREAWAGAGAGASHAPVVHGAEQPSCLECGRRFPQSYLFDTFGHSVCDGCRDADGAHALVTRTDAKSEFLLQDCDLDARPPPLRCERRRNPHARARGDMRLYLRAQVEQRALAVWGSGEALREERERRAARRARAAARGAARRLRQLRMDVRSSLYDRSHRPHDHDYDERRHSDDEDLYTRTCTLCGHSYTYEKM